MIKQQLVFEDMFIYNAEKRIIFWDFFIYFTSMKIYKRNILLC